MSDSQIKSEPVEGPKDSSSQPMDTSSSDQKSSSDVKPQTSNQPPKRTFVPNLAVERNKREVKQEQETTDRPRRQQGPNLNSARGRGRGGPGGGPQRGGARGSANVIQSHSIFEAGPAESSRRYGGRDADDSSYSYVGRESKSGDHAKKEKGSGDSGGPDVHNLRYEDNLLIEDVIANDPSVFVKLKLEGKDGENKQSGGSNNNVLIDLTAQDKLVLFQLPENLQLNSLGEGHVGKLRFRRSGKVELCLSTVTLNVTPSVSGQFLQDAAVIELPAGPETDIKQEYANSLINLGRIENKIVCSPKFF